MKEKQICDKILDAVSEILDVDKDLILSRSRMMPLPLMRGFFWYVLKRSLCITYKHLAEIMAIYNVNYTTSAIATSVNNIRYTISVEKYWRDSWETVCQKLELRDNRNSEENIELVVVVPKLLKDRIKFNVKFK